MATCVIQYDDPDEGPEIWSVGWTLDPDDATSQDDLKRAEALRLTKGIPDHLRTSVRFFNVEIPVTPTTSTAEAIEA